MLDVAIIGCGVVGAAAAYELSHYPLHVAVLEAENDVADGTTKANSAILHAGYDPEPGTQMARLNVQGVALAKEICARLDVPYRQCGSLVLALSQAELPHLQKLYANGVANGVPGIRLLTAEETLAMEPQLAPTVAGALFAPSAAIVSPWEFALAMAEVAVRNGVELYRSTPVTNIEKIDGGWQLTTPNGSFASRYVVNAAGLNAQAIHEMAAPHTFTLEPTRGEYYLLVLFLLQRALPAFFESCIWHGMALAAAPLALGFSLLAGRLFDPDHPTATPLLDKLNGLLSGRFEIWHHVFWGYPLYHPEQDGVPGWYHDAMPKAVTLLGGLATDGDEHHAIDNSFLAIPMNKGVLGAVVIGVIFLLLMWRLCQNHCTGETLFLTVILVYFLMENKCFLFSADPFILLLPAALFPAKGKPLPVVCPPVTRGCI